jgi:hypothetical protein
MSSVDIVEEAKKGKIVVIASKSSAGRIVPKNPSDASRVTVVLVD